MRLSEAIREGAKLRPQARGEYIDCHGATCAVGAAAHAALPEMFVQIEEEGTAIEPENVLVGFMDKLPMVVCPGCPESDAAYALWRRLDGVIVELNDFHSWTREQIADWLENPGI